MALSIDANFSFKRLRKKDFETIVSFVKYWVHCVQVTTVNVGDGGATWR